MTSFVDTGISSPWLSCPWPEHLRAPWEHSRRTGLWAVGRGREAPMTQQDGVSGGLTPSCLPSALLWSGLFHLATTSSGHLPPQPRPPLGPVFPVQPSQALRLPAGVPARALRPHSGACPRRALIAPPAQPTLGFSGRLPAPLTSAVPRPGWAGPEQLACRGLGPQAETQVPGAFGLYGGDPPHATPSGWAS